jgi:hypothetical protein
MDFTPTGVLLIIIGLFSFVYSTKWLFGLAVFFIPFTGTAVINIGSIDTGSSISPYMFFACLCIAKSLIVWRQKADESTLLHIKYIRLSDQNLSKLFLAGFVLIAALSLIMPVIINGRAMGNLFGNIDDLDPIKSTSRDITQFLYFLLGAIFTYFVASYTSQDGNLIFAIRVLGYSTIFLMCWGLLQFLSLRFSFVPYPVAVFNNSVNASLAKETLFLDPDAGLTRVNSVCAEPSILAQQLVVYFPFVLVGIEQKVYIFSKIKDYLLAGAIIIFVFITTSSSGMVCLALVMLLFFLSKRDIFTKQLWKLIIYVSAIIICIPIVYLIIPDIINAALLNKSDSFSALERLDTIISGWRNFIQYPFLGVGWGAITVNDFFVRILSNTGVLGFVFVVLMIYFIIKQHVTFSPKSEGHVNSYLNRSCILAFLILLFNCQIAGFSFYFGIFWLILGFCMTNKSKLIY